MRWVAERPLLLAAVSALLSPCRATSQEAGSNGATPTPLSVSPRTSLEAYRSARQSIELTLNRQLIAGDGELVLLVGTMDVTQLTTRSGTTLTIEPGAFPLPSGES